MSRMEPVRQIPTSATNPGLRGRAAGAARTGKSRNTRPGLGKLAKITATASIAAVGVAVMDAKSEFGGSNVAEAGPVLGAANGQAVCIDTPAPDPAPGRNDPYVLLTLNFVNAIYPGYLSVRRPNDTPTKELPESERTSASNFEGTLAKPGIATPNSVVAPTSRGEVCVDVVTPGAQEGELVGNLIIDYNGALLDARDTAGNPMFRVLNDRIVDTRMTGDPLESDQMRSFSVSSLTDVSGETFSTEEGDGLVMNLVVPSPKGNTGGYVGLVGYNEVPNSLRNPANRTTTATFTSGRPGALGADPNLGVVTVRNDLTVGVEQFNPVGARQDLVADLQLWVDKSIVSGSQRRLFDGRDGRGSTAVGGNLDGGVCYPVPEAREGDVVLASAAVDASYTPGMSGFIEIYSGKGRSHDVPAISSANFSVNGPIDLNTSFVAAKSAFGLPIKLCARGYLTDRFNSPAAIVDFVGVIDGATPSGEPTFSAYGAGTRIHDSR